MGQAVQPPKQRKQKPVRRQKPVTAYNRQRHRLLSKYTKELLENTTREERMLYNAFQEMKFSPKKQKGLFSKKSFYILDFFFKEKKVCVEVDGSSHDHRKDYDQERDNYLLKYKGILTLRYSNAEVRENARRVAEEVLGFIDRLPKYNHNRRKPHECNEIRKQMYFAFLERRSTAATVPH